MTVSGVANSLMGRADVSLPTLTETTIMARFMVETTGLLLICDASDGYGCGNAIHTVREFEAAGALAVQVEGRVSPKRCGSIAGKDVPQQRPCSAGSRPLSTRATQNRAKIGCC